MSNKLISDTFWAIVEPILPKHTHSPRGRPRVSDRTALTGIIFVLRTEIPWEELPQEMGCGSGMNCWWRLKEWQDASVWEHLHYIIILQKLHGVRKIDWERACIDGSVI